MALLFCDGFDHYATADIGKKWTTVITNGAAIEATTGRRGGGALMLENSSRVAKSVPAAQTMITGVALKSTGLSPAALSGRALIEFHDTTGNVIHLSLYPLADGSLHVYRGQTTTFLGMTATGLVTNGAYAYIEMKAKIDDAVGTVEVRVNGTSVLTLTGIDTRNAGNAYVNSVRLGHDVGSNVEGLFDDCYICDTSGSTNNDFLGDVRIDTLYPNADGFYSQLATSTGSTHYTLVDESVPSTTDYVSGGVAGLKDSYGFTDLTTTASVLGVQVCNLMYKDDAGSRSGANLVRSAGTDSQSATVALSTSPLYNLSVHQTDPATSAAWTQAAVNAMEAGPVVAA